MDLYKYLKLPTKDKLIFCHQITPSEIELDPDKKLINEIFVNLVNSCKRYNIDLINLISQNNFKVPSFVNTLYETGEGSIISKLPPSKWEESHHKLYDLRNKIRKENKIEKQRIFDDSKEVWCKLYPDFKRISDIMENYKTNEMLVEYGEHCPPSFIHNIAIVVFKKCISFKVKLTKKILSYLNKHPETYYLHYFESGIFCINVNVVKSFLKEYQLWCLSISNLWREIYYLNQDFYYNSGYNRIGWEFYIKYPDSLKSKADEIEKLHEKIITLLNSGKELVLKYDEAINLEYKTNAYEMSLFERELEIMQLSEGESAADEEYCFVYTLECELFVFYVGIAANPNERFEQHIRGAFSDEAHLFKSKFIQKYHKEVKQNIVYEGTRRECKKFERDYIAKHNPLGNMTEGGEG